MKMYAGALLFLPLLILFFFSNLMFIAAGEVLKAASGKPWAEYVTERFFVPLGMKRTRASVRGLGKVANVATPHGEVKGQLVTFPWISWDSMGAAGGVISSVNDMSLWIRMQLSEGHWEGRKYFSRESSRKMWKPHMLTGISASDRKRLKQVVSSLSLPRAMGLIVRCLLYTSDAHDE